MYDNTQEFAYGIEVQLQVNKQWEGYIYKEENVEWEVKERLEERKMKVVGIFFKKKLITYIGVPVQDCREGKGVTVEFSNSKNSYKISTAKGEN